MLKPHDRELLFKALNGDLLELEQIADVDAFLAELGELSPAAVASLLAEAAAAKFCDGSDSALADVMAMIPEKYQELLEAKHLWNCADLLVEVIPSDDGVFLQIIGFGVCVEAPNVEVAAEEAIELLNRFVQDLDLWTGPVAGQAAWQKHFRAGHRDGWFTKFARQLRDRAFNYPD
jgi:hypothetical protein